MLYDGLKIRADHNPSIYPSNSTTIGETSLVSYGSNMLRNLTTTLEKWSAVTLIRVVCCHVVMFFLYFQSM